ncbi:hypothetical protein [Sphingomonas sp.]|jgi:hypothetical protein|uniref:hypothetical protein n=1 Tax=Sphingomonas sp. TaxID=28214 RepID=UPI002DE4F755|nr:hypothetical protein [Sphingomonas sp.]
MDLKRRPDGSLSPDAKKIATWAAVGAVVGIPLPFVSFVGGAVIGGAIAAYRIHKGQG